MSNSAVMLGETFHVFANRKVDDTYVPAHYKVVGSTLAYVSAPPADFDQYVVFNDEIYALGCNPTSKPEYSGNLYKFDGSDWVVASALPYSNVYEQTAVVLDGRIHVFGGTKVVDGYDEDCKWHYAWDGSTWANVSTMPSLDNAFNMTAAVLNGEIHIIPVAYSSGASVSHYKFDGSSWVSVGTAPFDGRCGGMAELDGKLYFVRSRLGCKPDISGSILYVFDGSNWSSYRKQVKLPNLIHVSVLARGNKLFVFDSSTSLVSDVVISPSDMSVYPMTDYLQSYLTDGAALVNVADSIRTKSGKTGKLSFPDGFTSAIDSLPTVTVDGERYTGSRLNLTKSGAVYDGTDPTATLPPLPYACRQGQAVVLNDAIHILGGAGNKTGHYKFDGTAWTSVSTLPYSFYQGSAVVYNGKIYLLGGYESYAKFYEFDGSTWSETSISEHYVSGNLPYNFLQGSAVVYNGEIHILGSINTSGYSKFHYKFDGTTWTSVSTLPYSFYQGSAVVYDDEIHILGGTGNTGSHYRFNGTTWVNAVVAPHGLHKGAAVVYDNEIYILGGAAYGFTFCKFNGSTWTDLDDLNYTFVNAPAVVYNNEIHALSSDSNSMYYMVHKKYSTNVGWTVLLRVLPYKFWCGSSVVYNNEIHILGGTDYSTVHYKFDGNAWVSVSTLPYNFQLGSAVVYNNAIYILGGASGGYTAYKFDGTAWTSVSTLPYNFYRGSAVVYNGKIHILGGDSYYNSHYVFDGSSWSELSVSSIPYSFYNGSAVVVQDLIYIMGGSANSTFVYTYDNSVWTRLDCYLPKSLVNGAAVYCDDAIFILGYTSSEYVLYRYDGDTWLSIGNTPFAGVYQGDAVVLDGSIYYMLGYVSSSTLLHYGIITVTPTYVIEG